MTETNDKLVERLKRVESQAISSTRFNNRPIFWDSASVCDIYDSKGVSYIDCTSSYGVMGIGYSNHKLIKDVEKQLHLLTHSMNEMYPQKSYLLAMEAICDAIGRPNDQVLLTTSGSDAVEAALKLAFRYTGKFGVITFQGAFHGQTLGALSVTSHNCFKNPFLPYISNNAIFIPYPNKYRNPFDSEEMLLKSCLNHIEMALDSKKSGHCPVGAIIVEPMQNASGYILPPSGFLCGLREICDRHNILLITDEIFTGFGRCGKWLMADYENVHADIVCVGKVMTGGFPAAACVASREIMASMDYDGMVPLHGSTFLGNSLTSAAICSSIEILKSDNLVEQSREKGEYFRKQLRSILNPIPTVGDIRGIGMATMIEFVESKENKVHNAVEAENFSKFMLEHGIITLISGLPYGNCVAFCMPFVIPKYQIDLILRICSDFSKNH